MGRRARGPIVHEVAKESDTTEHSHAYTHTHTHTHTQYRDEQNPLKQIPYVWRFHIFYELNLQTYPIYSIQNNTFSHPIFLEVKQPFKHCFNLCFCLYLFCRLRSITTIYFGLYGKCNLLMQSVKFQLH